MKTSSFAPFWKVLLIAAVCSVTAEASDRTANDILATPQKYENQEVTLDVAFLKPVHWKSPLPELAFFHALTMDRQSKRPGGGILTAVAADEVETMVKRYGSTYDGRQTRSLKGTLLLIPGKRGSGLWILDTTGKAAELIKAQRLNTLENLENSNTNPGPGNRPRRLRTE